MQYYIKIYNKTTENFVGYYKETGRNRISRLQNGIRYFNDLEEALEVLEGLDDGFIRDIDKHYYSSAAIICGDHTRSSEDKENKSISKREEELKDELDAFIRQNCNKKR